VRLGAQYFALHVSLRAPILSAFEVKRKVLRVLQADWVRLLPVAAMLMAVPSLLSAFKNKTHVHHACLRSAFTS
jgi:hypothetical protein